MAVEFCEFCGCLKLKNGYCRDTKCIRGNCNAVTAEQMNKISELEEELGLEKSSFSNLDKTEASKLISRLIKRKLTRIALGEEEGV